jgi:hypothetical protein
LEDYVLGHDSLFDLWTEILAEQLESPNGHSLFVPTPDTFICPPNGRMDVHRADHIQGYIIMRTSLGSVHSPVNLNPAHSITEDSLFVMDSDFQLMAASTSGLVAIPFSPTAHSCLIGTFLHPIISLKHLVRILTRSELGFEHIRSIKHRLYTLVFHSIIVNSVFFAAHGNAVLDFLSARMPIEGIDLSEEFLYELRLFAACAETGTHPYIKRFIDDQRVMLSEQSLFPLKKLFPEFLTVSEQSEVSRLAKTAAVELPASVFPLEVNSSSVDAAPLISALRRIFAPRHTISGFPFHLIIPIWSTCIQLTPPIAIRRINKTVICVTFPVLISPEFRIQVPGLPRDWRLGCGSDAILSSGLCVGPDTVFSSVLFPDEIYLQLVGIGASWDGLPLIVCGTTALAPALSLALTHRSRLISDLTLFVTEWPSNVDSTILSRIPAADFTAQNLFLIAPASALVHLDVTPHLALLRTLLLRLLNWLAGTELVCFERCAALRPLAALVSRRLKHTRFRQRVLGRSGTGRHPHLRIDRRSALDPGRQAPVLLQLARSYMDPDDFRSVGDRPWTVRFSHEAGVDAGGPGRELFAAAALELTSPATGLVMPVPNARYGVGRWQDCVIPVPAADAMDAPAQYRTAGVLLGMCIRSGLAQPFAFPPLVWRFLVGEDLTVEGLFEIDDHYKTLVETLREAQATLTEREFAERFDLSFVVTNAAGREVALTVRGTAEPVTHMNCALFIAIANEMRLAEVRAPLECMREGLWENLKLGPDLGIDWQTLEFAACGERQIELDKLKKGTRFEGFQEQQIELFWRVVASFSPAEVSELLKFATGRIRLPPEIEDGDVFLKVDSLDGVDRLPRAATCSQTLHCPAYSSFEKERQMLLVAINFTGSFELH